MVEKAFGRYLIFVLCLIIDTQLFQQILKCFRRIEVENDFAFFVIGGFDFGVNTQPFGQNVVQTTYIGADGFFDFLFGLMGDLAVVFDFAYRPTVFFWTS